MLFAGSRYASTPRAEISADPAGVPPALALRRLPPTPGVLEHVVMDGERLDQLAARFYGDPTRYWRILDANPGELNPLMLLRAGRRIGIPPARGVAE